MGEKQPGLANVTLDVSKKPQCVPATSNSQLSRNQYTLSLAGLLVDLRDARIAVVALDRVAP